MLRANHLVAQRQRVDDRHEESLQIVVEHPYGIVERLDAEQVGRARRMREIGTRIYRRTLRALRLLAVNPRASPVVDLPRGADGAAYPVEELPRRLETLVVVGGILLDKRLRELRQGRRLAVELLLILTHPDYHLVHVVQRVALLPDAFQKALLREPAHSIDDHVQVRLIFLDNSIISHNFFEVRIYN